jgi:hypothetical protein
MSIAGVRALLLGTWADATGRTVIMPEELQGVLALAPGMTSERAAADTLGALYARPAIVAALERGHMRELANALRSEGLTDAPAATLARILMHNAQAAARSLGEPVRVMLARPDGPRPDRVLTVDGWMRLEEEYLPRVVTRENGMAHTEALKAQAIAARTFVLCAMRDRRSLGRTQPIENGEHFQAYAAKATTRAIEATEATRGTVGRYKGELIIANYVAGAIWKADGSPGNDPTNTERWVTYNEGRTGDAVRPTKLSLSTRSDNRGCKSQNGADWLGRHGQAYPAILRFFYGADLELTGPHDVPGSTETEIADSAGAAPLLMVAAAAVGLTLWGL